jgi:hypothetical protein
MVTIAGTNAAHHWRVGQNSSRKNLVSEEVRNTMGNYPELARQTVEK